MDEKVVEALGLGFLREFIFVAEFARGAQPGMGSHSLDRAPGDAFIEEALGLGAGQFLGLAGNDIDRQTKTNVGAPILQRTRAYIGNQRGNFVRVLSAHQVEVGVLGGELPGRDR
ncbi:hypothetical protein D3C76_1488220 [compost metagenome]